MEAVLASHSFTPPKEGGRETAKSWGNQGPPESTLALTMGGAGRHTQTSRLCTRRRASKERAALMWLGVLFSPGFFCCLVFHVFIAVLLFLIPITEAKGSLGSGEKLFGNWELWKSMAGRSLWPLPGGGDRDGVGIGSCLEASCGGVNPLALPGEAGLGAGYLPGWSALELSGWKARMPARRPAFLKMGCSGSNSVGSQRVLYGGNIPESKAFEKGSQSRVFFLSTGLLRTLGFPGGWDGKESACSAEDPGLGRFPREGIATHSSILAWRIQWTEEPNGLQSLRLQRVGHDWASFTHLLSGS